LHTPRTCVIQGEGSVLDSLKEPYRGQSGETLVETARDIDLFIAPSRYFAELMGKRLKIPPDRMRVVYNGITLDGYIPAASPPSPPVLGYFSRMSKMKGLDLLIEAFILLKQRGRIESLKLKVGG